MLITPLRQSIRSLMRAPIFSVFAVLFLGFGIGGAVSVFAIARALIERPPYQEPEHLVEIWSTPSPSSQQRVDMVPGDRMSGWSQNPYRSLEFVGVRASRSFVLAGDVPERVEGELISSGAFEALGVEPRLGRSLNSGDGEPGAEPAVVVSEGFWKSRLGHDPSALGRSLRLSGEVFTVVGVMPRALEAGLKVWMPAEGRLRSEDFGLLIGRLRSGASIEDAAAEVQYVAAAEVAADSSAFGGMGAVAVPIGAGERPTGQIATLWVLGGMATVVLMLTLTNLTTLLLARSTARARGVAVRIAMGATPGQLGARVLAENLVLALAGAVVGVLLAGSALGLARAAIGDVVQVPYDLGLDALVVLFASSVALMSAIVLGLEPLRHLGRVPVTSLLHAAGSPTATRGPTERRARHLSIAIQIALTTVLVSTLVVLGKAHENWARVDLGYDAANVVTAFADWNAVGLPDAEQWALGSAVAQRLSSHPSAEGVTLWRQGSTVYPGRPEYDAVFEGGSTDFNARLRLHYYYHVGENFLRTVGIPLVAGRDFGPADRAGSPRVGIVSESGANAWWPGRQAVGRRLRLGESGEWITIIGVAEDAAALTPTGRMFSPASMPSVDSNELPQLYLPAAQGTATPIGWRIDGAGFGLDGVVVAARVGDDQGRVADALLRELAALEPGLPVTDVGTLTDIQLGTGSTRTQAIYGRLVQAVAAYALLLALFGIVAAIAQAAVVRAREIGIRTAVGAKPHDLRLLLVRDAGLATALGIASGVLILFAFDGPLSRVLGDLQGASITDPTALALTGGGILLAAIGAGLMSAWRAGDIDPSVALRAD